MDAVCLAAAELNSCDRNQLALYRKCLLTSALNQGHSTLFNIAVCPNLLQWLPTALRMKTKIRNMAQEAVIRLLPTFPASPLATYSPTFCFQCFSCTSFLSVCWVCPAHANFRAYVLHIFSGPLESPPLHFFLHLGLIYPLFRSQLKHHFLHVGFCELQNTWVPWFPQPSA